MGEPSSSMLIMHGAREAMASGLGHIEEQVAGIERAVSEQPSLAFELARTLIESTCRAILAQRGVAFDRSDGLPKLFKEVSSRLPFLPASAPGEAGVRKSLAQTLGGLKTALQGVCELRNALGTVSHGAEGPRPVMESAQALLAAQAADAIVGFIHRVHSQDRALTKSQALEFATNQQFNDYIDDAHAMVRLFDVEYRPSEVLYSVDMEAYRVLLAEFDPAAEAEA